ncbi:MAG: TlpA family protein disulfide reductase [Terriglobales bacterium]
MRTSPAARASRSVGRRRPGARRVPPLAGWAALAICVAVAGWAAPAARAAGTDVVLFKKPMATPGLHLVTLNGQAIQLAALRGKVVLLNFWATWCGPCRMEIPEFERLQREYPRQLQIIGLSVDTSPARDVAAVAKQLGMNYPVVMATDTMQAKFGAVPAVPTTYVIDRQGQIVQRDVGLHSYAEFDSSVRALLGLPFGGQIIRVDEMNPNGPVGTTQIPGLIAAFKKLTPKQREEALAKLNSMRCTCGGCEYSLANCRVEDPDCGVSLPEARKILAAIAAEK